MYCFSPSISIPTLDNSHLKKVLKCSGLSAVTHLGNVFDEYGKDLGFSLQGRQILARIVPQHQILNKGRQVHLQVQVHGVKKIRCLSYSSISVR